MQINHQQLLSRKSFKFHKHNPKICISLRMGMESQRAPPRSLAQILKYWYLIGSKTVFGKFKLPDIVLEFFHSARVVLSEISRRLRMYLGDFKQLTS